MPENQSPATQPEPGAEPGEFDFAKPTARLKRRSLKAKTGATPKATNGSQPAAHEPERATVPLPIEQAAQAKPTPTPEIKPTPVAKAAATPTAPPRTLPATATATTTQAASPMAKAAPAAPSTSSPASSPHGTRPATLYYTSNPRKAETPTPMKNVPTARPASSASSTPSTSPASSTGATTTLPSSMARAAAVSSASSRPTGTVDYRANVERQSREQKSVGNILSYIVYGFIALFVIVVGLAGYGADIIFKQLHEQSATVSDLDARYAAANKDLTTKLAATNDTLAEAQTQIARQQELIMKQQEDLNRLIGETTDNTNALKAEKQARAQETANLRARVRELEERGTSTTTQKF